MWKDWQVSIMEGVGSILINKHVGVHGIGFVRRVRHGREDQFVGGDGWNKFSISNFEAGTGQGDWV